MIVHRSHRAEALVHALADVVRDPAHADPVRPETIVVQSLGMERWLAQRLSRRLGVWANPAFPFPRKIVLEALEAVLGTAARRAVAPFESHHLIWPVAAELANHLDAPVFAPLASYLADDPRGVKRIQLARRIATVFDDYVVYRPEMVRAWDANGAPAVPATDTDDWQPILWRAVRARLADKGTHIASRIEEFLRAVDRPALDRAGFPSRVCLFGLATLPKLYLDVFAALARHVDVHFFMLSPSPAASDRLAADAAAVRGLVAAGAAPGDLDAHLDLSGFHPLVASCGRVARDFDALLAAVDVARVDDLDGEGGTHPHPGALRAPVPPPQAGEGTRGEVPPLARVPSSPAGGGGQPGGVSRKAGGGERMLAAIQSDLVANRPPPASSGRPRLPLDPGDRSISVHACHGPMREVEVLRDQLLDRLNRDPSLRPHDIAVMAPDIERYAPYIQAVFDVPPRDPTFIPFRIADRAPVAAFDVVGALDKVLAALQGRLTASDVLDLLAVDGVRRRFGIPADRLDTLRRWVGDAGIRWAVDAGDRAAAGQPDLDANTWRFGLARLFLGYAMPGRDRDLFRGVLPYDDIEGAEAELLGNLGDACETLFDLRAAVRRTRTVDAWQTVLADVLARMVDQGPRNAWQHQLVKDALIRVAYQAANNDFGAEIDVGVMWDLALGQMGDDAPPHGFLGGGATFCALLPMRSIPFRIVALLGMNDGAFPRLARRPSFDRLAAQPRIGDRSTRADDRHMFLEALLAARDHLIVTYAGQGIQDGRRIAPSVVVTELLDMVGQSFESADVAPGAESGDGAASAPGIESGDGEAAAADAIRDAVTTWHPGQPFSPRYFAPDPGGALFSFNRPFAAGARALAGDRRPAPAFVPEPLPPIDDAAEDLGLAALAAFFRNPARAFLRRRLGLYLGGEADLVEDREPLALGGAAERDIANRWLRRLMAGDDAAAIATAVRAAGVLPPGTPGDCAFDDLAPTLGAMARAAAGWQTGSSLDPLEVAIEIEGVPFTGVLPHLWPRAQVWIRFGRVARGSELELWVHHLALCAAAESARPIGHDGDGDVIAGIALPTTSILIGRPAEGDGVAVIRFAPVKDALPHLADLVALYRFGQTAPLAFFQGASRTYAEALQSGKDDVAARKQARRVYQGSEGRGYSDLDDPAVALIHADVDPTGPDCAADPAFDAVARRVFEPLLAHREVVEEE